MMRIVEYLPVLVLSFAGTQAFAAKVYKCAGPDGKTIYTDKACDSTSVPKRIWDSNLGSAPAPIYSNGDTPTFLAGGNEPERPVINKAGPAVRQSSVLLTLEGTGCLGDHGYIRATGYVVNSGYDATRARVTATFLKDGTVMDTLTLGYSVEGRGRTAFSIAGGRSGANKCEYSVTWD